MNDLAKITRSGGRQFVALPKGIELPGDELRVHLEGRRLVLEPVEIEAAGMRSIAPGHYSSETLPPVGAGAAAILASVDCIEPLTSAEEAAAKRESSAFDVEDAPKPPLVPDDEPLPGFDPDS